MEHPENIKVGDKVYIGYQTWLAATPHVSSAPELIIGDGSSIGRWNQLYSTTSIIVEEKVLTADRVFISDSWHDWMDIHVPIMEQPVKSKGGMRIGAGTWIGINACIVGANIGKNCVIGANSVVTKDIPDYCIVGGIPAKILKQYNPATGKWEKPIL